MQQNETKRAWLVLQDGSVYPGVSFGAEGTTVGETVFNTGMTGYQEVLTDPSYYGQIVTQTYPLIGNYGINNDDMESGRSWVKGYIVSEWCETPSNFRVAMDLDAFLKSQNVIAIAGIDTRALTKKLRESGVMNGAITTEYDESKKDALLEQIRAYTIADAVAAVSCTAPASFPKAEGTEGDYHVVLCDYGYKRNIVRSLQNRGCRVTVVPGHTSAEEILALRPDGIMLSNGPGDPAENTAIIAEIAKLLPSGVPIFGICLGHQLPALATGAATCKLKYGHRGSNQPVKDRDLDRTFITSQNHGYAVEGDSFDTNLGRISHVNANDGTVEGIRYERYNCFTVQFHPEASAGPKDTAYLFDEFIDRIKDAKGDR